MAYRRRQQVGRVETPFTYNNDSAPAPAAADSSSSSSSASSLAAKAIRASSAYRDSSLSSVYEQSALSSPRGAPPSSAQASSIYEHTSKKEVTESKQGFWGVLARKAKAILDDDDNTAQPHETAGGTTLQTSDGNKKDQYRSAHDRAESRRKTDGPGLQKRLDSIASSLNYIGGTIGNALEEGITKVENRTADIIQETRKIQIRRKSGTSRSQNQASNLDSLRQQPALQAHAQPQMHTDLETQLKASRDVAMAMAAKAKLLLRELKTVKADLAFAKERCAQLEEENRILRESREKGDNPEDDDLIRLQLESLLAEKARLAQENSVYARENRFLREIVEYHQLTMQDVVYLDEGSEEVTEVYPIKITTATNTQSFGTMLSPTPTIPHGAIPQIPQNISPDSAPSTDLKEPSQAVNTVNPYVQMPSEDVKRH
ncbi:hypothetical protein CDL12_06493 [Handroanthus impetiginosus]|uniref:Uncharacterized protein n=1 Tax=Handroanthus impetiginosus TaxID=429701 RepID=A0A2G9HTH7_9LAMI|nr:hypothetical protein CDL12_06493 [Handroanthus impetiginosus]